MLRNVYANREQEIELKKKLKDQEQWMKQYERQNMEAEVER